MHVLGTKKLALS